MKNALYSFIILIVFVLGLYIIGYVMFDVQQGIRVRTDTATDNFNLIINKQNVIESKIDKLLDYMESPTPSSSNIQQVTTELNTTHDVNQHTLIIEKKPVKKELLLDQVIKDQL